MTRPPRDSLPLPAGPADHSAPSRPAVARAAFTLIEMLVSLAVLAIALTVVGVVFSVTTKTTTQAAAFSEAQGRVRQFMLQLEEDLKYCSPENGPMFIFGRTQAAALTRDDLEAGRYHRVLTGDPTEVPVDYHPEFDSQRNLNYSNPRADVLIFFTNRAVASQCPATGDLSNNEGFQISLQNGAKVAPIQVIYGHAAIGQAALNGTEYVWNDSREGIQYISDELADGTKRSVLPATRWHLARRALLIEPVPNLTEFPPAGNEFWPRANRCQADPAWAADSVQFDYPLFLRLLNGYVDVTGRDRPQNKGLLSTIRRATFGDDGWGAGSRLHMATVLEEPPAELRSNLGVHMLPGCAWFQVEYLMPEDPRNSLDYYNPTADSLVTDLSERFDMPRWVSVPPQAPNNYVVFFPDTAENREIVSRPPPSGGYLPPYGRVNEYALIDPTIADPPAPNPPLLSNRRIRLWPYAIRITVHVYDPRGRLEEPIVRSIVHRFE